jgi:hypothetical protein
MTERQPWRRGEVGGLESAGERERTCWLIKITETSFRFVNRVKASSICWTVVSASEGQGGHHRRIENDTHDGWRTARDGEIIRLLLRVDIADTSKHEAGDGVLRTATL